MTVTSSLDPGQRAGLQGNEHYERPGEWIQELRFHILGIVEAQDSLRQLCKDLDQQDQMKLARTLSLLEVELLDHIGHHLQELKNPLKLLLKNAYQDLEPESHSRKDEE